MIPRFYAPSASDTDDEVQLPPEEAHHLAHVMRLRPGDAVRVFDGRGREWDTTVAAIARRAVTLARGARQAPVPEPTIRITLAVGVLKPEYMELAIRNAVMAGVAAIQPLCTAHSVRTTRDLSRAPILERWRRIVVSSVKQCGRAVVPEVFAPEAFDAWIERQAAFAACRLLLAEPSVEGAARVDLLALREAAIEQGIVLLVGPEGGWQTDEVARAEHVGFRLWRVSDRILRADAAALAALSVLLYVWEHETAGGKP